MKKFINLFFTFSICACSNAKDKEFEIIYPKCINSPSTVCATYDYSSKVTKKEGQFTELIATIVSGGHADMRHKESINNNISLDEIKLNLNKHIWDFSNTPNSILFIEANNSQISNGIILNGNLMLGEPDYFPPNFSQKNQKNNLNIDSSINKDLIKNYYLYANNDFNCKRYSGKNCNFPKKIENNILNQLNMHVNNLNIKSWNSIIINSSLVINNSINIDGSKVTIKNNTIITKANLKNKKTLFPLTPQNLSKYNSISVQIFPDQWDEQTAIPNALYIKFSPDTIIDGNTFTLTQKNDQAYAIVLDHSPRVRITNNTFNGFKVPILMDQWSSIVDEKGNEIKPENFNGYGNVINPDKFAGNVTMNRKGEIVKE